MLKPKANEVSMKVTKKTRLLAKLGPVINSVYSEGHEGEPNKLYDGINIHVTGSNLNKADRLQVHFYATNGEGHSFDFGEHMIVALEDSHWIYRGQWLYETMRATCEESGCVLDMSRGGQIELIAPTGVLAFRGVTFDI